MILSKFIILKKKKKKNTRNFSQGGIAPHKKGIL